MIFCLGLYNNNNNNNNNNNTFCTKTFGALNN